MRIVVVGGGAIGLTTAARLLEAGLAVSLVAREITPETTSDVAAAFWSPGALYGGDGPRRRAFESLRAFRGLATIPESGVAIVDQHTLADHAVDVPDFGPELPVWAAPAGRFPPPWTGFTIAAPRIDVPVYMPWLLAHVRALGGDVRQGEVSSLEAASEGFEAVVNCTGLGAATLASDRSMVPIRGQVMLVRRPAGMPDDVVHAETERATTYIVPRSGDVLLGGIYQYGESNLEPDASIAAGILERCAAFYPQLRDAEVLRHRVGLRPGRESVRLEAARLANGRLVVHNYGHGSVGHTLSWGCAAEVRDLVAASSS